MASNTTKDMTTGSSMKLILGFAVPLLMGMLFQQVYSLVDTIIVGRFLGVNALAAVGATGSINFLIIGFCLGLCTARAASRLCVCRTEPLPRALRISRLSNSLSQAFR